MTDVMVLDPVLLTELAKQGIAAVNLELLRDFAPSSRGQGYSPYARCYIDKVSGKNLSVISALPMVDAYGQLHELTWQDKNGAVENGNNIFHAVIDKGMVHLLSLSDQPIGVKKDDEEAFHPQLFIDGAEILPLSDAPRLLDVDPINENYHNNVLEWDYGVCLRRIRLIEGRFLGSWVFVTNPRGDALIKYNQSGDFRLRLQYAQDDDTEFISRAFFDAAREWPVTISDSATFYPDANPETSSVDGVVYQTGTAPWTTLIGAAGSGSNDSNNYDVFTFIQARGSTNNWAELDRSIFLFDTSALPDTAVISATTLSLYGKYKVDGLSATPDLNVYSSTPASNTALVAGDFDSLGSTAFCDTPITYAGFSTTGYNDLVFNATGIAAISLTGATKFGVRNANHDVAASSPTWVDSAQSYLQGYYAEKGTGYQPKLVVTYTTGVTEKSSAETGAGVDVITSDNPIVITSGTETGSGLESLDSRDLANSETASGLESVDGRDLGNAEVGSGLDIASLLTALTGDEIGLGTEAALKIAAFFSGDAGLGTELSWMLKDALSGDAGGGYDALNSLIKKVGSGSDMRLYERLGQERISSKQEKMPSKGVNI